MKNILVKSGPFAEFKEEFIPRKLMGCFINPGPASTNTPTVLAGGSAPEGFQIGSTSQSKVAAYGVSPAVVQRLGAAQALIPVSAPGASSGLVIAMNVSTVVPSSGTVSASTISPMAVTFASTNMVSSDLVIVNKITAQAGMGIAGARVSTVSTILIDYVNATASNVTATAGEAYLAIGFRGLSQAVTLSPAAVPAASTSDQSFTVTGLAVGELVYVVKPSEQVGLGIVNARVPANNTLALTFLNQSNATITPTAAEAYSFVALPALNADNNMLTLQAVTASSLATISGNTVTTVAITVTGLVPSDLTLGAERSAVQNNLAVVGARVSALNVLEVTYMSAGTSSQTPTTGELLTIPLLRSTPVNPMILQTVTLAPTVVGALTTAEVAFAVSNITVSTVVWVNKTSYTSGLGVVGCRAVSTNVLGITYVNNTTVSITPPSEPYLVANFPLAIGVGHTVLQQVHDGNVINQQLTNEVRQALVNLGFIVGS